MDYWKTKVLPKVKKVFGKNGTKKAAAAEACKNFDDSKVTSIHPSLILLAISFILYIYFQYFTSFNYLTYYLHTYIHTYGLHVFN